MRPLFSALASVRTNRIVRKVESLEQRRLFSGPPLVDPIIDFGGITDPNTGQVIYPDASPALPADSPPGGSGGTQPLTAVPILNSLPGSSHEIYLDFVGAPAMTWGQTSVPATPAYDIDGDPSTFSSQEITNIQQIWSQVAEAYSPFNVNVTTVDPDPVNHTNYPHGQVARIVIGGNGSWVGQSLGGISYIGSFDLPFFPNTSFVFPSMLSYDNDYIADGIAHEAGHEFGLYHQSTYSGTTLTSEYNYGNSEAAPTIGCAYYSSRGLWWDGPDDQGSTDIQDDMSVISGNIGYRTEPSDTSISTAAALTASGTSVSAAGVIEHPTDMDVYSFTTAAGTITMNVNVAPYGAMLQAQELLENASGSVLATGENASTLAQSISATVPAGKYFLVVEGTGQSGTVGQDVGQYFVSGNVAAAAPVIIVPASGSASPVTTTSTTLTVQASDPVCGASGLLYSWQTVGAQPGNVVFGDNADNSARSCTATFSAAGTYTLLVTATDPLDQESSTSSLSIAVVSTLTSIQVTSSSGYLVDGQSSQLTATALDQFGTPLSVQPAITWNVSGGGLGSITSTGMYTGPQAGPAVDVVNATAGTISASTTMTVFPSEINSAGTNLRLSGSGQNLVVYYNSTQPTEQVPLASFGALSVALNAANDVVNLDFSGSASPVTPAGITLAASGQSDGLIVTGSSGNDAAVVGVNTLVFDASAITYSGFSTLTIDGNGGSDSLLQTQQPANHAGLTFNGGVTGGPSPADSLNISGGTFAFAAPQTGFGLQPITLASLAIGSGANVTLGTASAHSDRSILTLGSISLQGSGQLDLGGNDMIIQNPADLSAVSAAMTDGYNVDVGLPQTNPSIMSSSVHNDTSHLTALGEVQEKLPQATFDNQNVSAGQILVKYTYYGDANLNGKVDGSDYSLIDNGFLLGLSGWANGDFNYDGVVNGSDYTLIDNAFNRQGASLAELVSTIPSSQVASVFSSLEVVNTSLDPGQIPVPASETPGLLTASSESEDLRPGHYRQSVVAQIDDLSTTSL